MVTVTRVAGSVPVLQIADSAKAQRIATEWRTAIESVAADYASLTDRKRYSGGWLNEEDFSRVCKLGSAMRAARKLRTHAARMKRLAPVLSVSGQLPATTGQQELF